MYIKHRASSTNIDEPDLCSESHNKDDDSAVPSDDESSHHCRSGSHVSDDFESSDEVQEKRQCVTNKAWGVAMPLGGSASKKAWAKKGLCSSDLDTEFMKTMSRINKAINNEATCTDEDDDKLFCLSLVKQLKEMDAKHKSPAKIQTLKVFHDIGMD